MDLQLFAEGEEQEQVTETEVNEEEAQEEEVSEEQTQAEEETQTEPVKQEEPKPEVVLKDYIPLAKHLEVKKQLKALKQKLLADEEEKERIRLQQEFIERGYYEQEAERLAKEKIEQKREAEEIKQWRLENAVQKLAASGDEFYEDADVFQDDIIEKIKEMNLPSTIEGAKVAYQVLRGEIRAKEILQKREQRAVAERTKAKPPKVETATSTPIKSKYALTEDDRKALRELQKAQPNANWNEKTYWELMYGEQ